MAEKKKPLSLNERHSRLLQDLSTSQSRPHHKPHSLILATPSEEVKQSKVKLGDDAPQFSGILDFGSPSPAEKPSNINMESEVSSRNQQYTSIEVSTQKFSDFVVTDFTSHPETDKGRKVKLEGRRRLCKFSSDGNNNDGESKHIVENDHLELNKLHDFDKTQNESGFGCDNEIRGILSELTSRLDALSIEKKRVPKRVELVTGSSVSDLKNVNNEPRAEDFPEFTSAGSSFSLVELSDSSSYSTNPFLGDAGLSTELNECEKENNLESKSEGDDFVGKVNRYNNGQNKNESGTITGTSVCMEQSVGSNIGGEEEEEDDDCVILSGKNIVKGERQRGKFAQVFNGSDEPEIIDDYDDISVLEEENAVTLSGPTSTYKLPGKIGKMLYPHQRDGLKWLWSLHVQGKGGILGDDMGLGKTMQICGFLAGLFHSSLIKRALVVAPKTLIPHWIKELSAVGLSEKTREYFGTSAKVRQYELQYVLQDKGVLLTTYDIVRNNAKSLRGDSYFHDDRSDNDITWDYMILDEGHLIKNPSTQRAKSLLEIPCAHRIIISGTPIQNNLKELWALFNFCCPELLGDKNWFKEKYEYLILRGNEKNASDREKHIGSTVAKDLREHIQPYFLRRLKNEVFCEDAGTNTAKLSKKHEIIVWLRLTSCQRQLYEAFLKSEIVLSVFDGSPLAALTILKKICDHPLLLTKRAAEDVLEGMDSMLNPEEHGVAEKLAMHLADATEINGFEEKHANISCKISFILSLLDNLIPKGHHVLVFSQTRKMLNLIQESLESNGYKFLRIDGTTKAADRLKIVNDFQGGGAPIFLLTSQVGGLGLTLTKADRVIVADPAWNPSMDNQSVDRAYRIGQEKDVLVYRLMTCGTVEEKIYRKQIYKGGLFKTATEHKEQIRYFSQQDLRELFSLPKQGFDISLTQQQLHEEHDRQHKMDESLETHINFLGTLGIGGISHHSLLFSKTAPVTVVEVEDEATRIKGPSFIENSYQCSSLERNVDGAEYAFNPKDVKLQGKFSSPTIIDPSEADLKERIQRLSQIYANKATISKLPDKGEKIRRQISDLTMELDHILMEKRTKRENIDLDDITGDFQRVLNV